MHYYGKQMRALILIFMLPFSIVVPQTTDTHSDQLTTSLIIPCCPKHAKHLYELLKRYEHQTELPDEVVIALSSSAEVDTSILDTLTNELWRFPITLLLSKERYFAGENRNRASHSASGNLLIFQDADDIPFPQRIEIIKYFFKKYQIKHLIHTCIDLKSWSNANFEPYTHFDKIPFFYPKNYQEIWDHGGYFTNGNIAILKTVLQTVTWPDNRRGQDTIFNEIVYKYFSNRIAINIPLLVHCSFLSSHESPSEKVTSRKKGARAFMGELKDELEFVPDKEEQMIENKLIQIKGMGQELSAITAAKQQRHKVQIELQDPKYLSLVLHAQRNLSLELQKQLPVPTPPPVVRTPQPAARPQVRGHKCWHCARKERKRRTGFSKK